MSNLPSLIQRVRARKHPSDVQGIDRLFEFDYMGSSEFEFGTLGKALKIMRAAKKDWKVETVEVEVADAGDRTQPAAVRDVVAYFVGRPEDRETAKKLLEDQLQKHHQHHTKEITSMRVSFGLAEPFGYGVYDGWWTVDAGWQSYRPSTPFVIFRKREHAEMWLGEL